MEGVDAQLQALGIRHKDDFGKVYFDPLWLQVRPLTLDELPEYFYMSDFYDPAANNEKTREDLSKLKQMKGLEYTFEQPNADIDIFHVRKQYRYNEKKTVDLALYYVHQGRIYQAPTLHAVIRAKLQNISGDLQSSITALARYVDASVDKSEMGDRAI